MNNKKALTINEIHKETLGVLKKFISICDEIGVNYFVTYGSLIGAVRHKGFIPWDDDFDVFMTRPEYEKFVEYCMVNANEILPFKLMDYNNTIGYPYGIARFNDLRFRLVSAGYANVGMGIFIDIYPLDGVGNDLMVARKLFLNKKKLYMKLWGIKIAGFHNRINLLKRPINWIFDKVSTFLGMDYLFYLKKLDALKNVCNYDESKYISVLVWDRSLYFYEKCNFEDFEILKFEGIDVKVPKNCNEVLRNIYGDYMKLPPIEKRIPTHNYMIYRK